MTAGTTCWSRTGHAAPAAIPATTSAWADRKKVTGPFVDNMGVDMIQGGGKLFAGSSGRHIGPGHFGLIDLGDGVQKFSCHYESDLDRGGASVLDIRPLLWRDGWPVAGDNLTAGTYEIQSARTGTALEMAVQGVPVGGGRGRGGRGGGGDPGVAATGRRRPDPGAGRRTGQRQLARRRRSTCAWRPTWSRRNRSGRSPRLPMPAAIPDRRFSRSRLRAPTVRSPPPGTPSWWSCPLSPVDLNNCGASISSPTARIG